jgi:hypothetical protein
MFLAFIPRSAPCFHECDRRTTSEFFLSFPLSSGLPQALSSTGKIWNLFPLSSAAFLSVDDLIPSVAGHSFCPVAPAVMLLLVSR